MFTPRLLLATCGLTAVHAHMQLEYPPPFNASNNPHRTGPADNIYVYPAGCCGREDTKATCRGYLSLLGTPEGAPVATWAAGSKVTWNITGDPAITLNDLGGKLFTILPLYFLGSSLITRTYRHSLWRFLPGRLLH